MSPASSLTYENLTLPLHVASVHVASWWDDSEAGSGFCWPLRALIIKTFPFKVDVRVTCGDASGARTFSAARDSEKPNPHALC